MSDMLLFGAICLIVPLIIIVTTITLYYWFTERKTKKVEKVKTVFIIILIALVIILSYTLYVYYTYSIEYDPYKGDYSYKAYVEYVGSNDTVFSIDLPLPHDDRIYSELEFYQDVDKQIAIHPGIQYLNYSIDNSTYGNILHIETNKSFFVYCTFWDENNEIDPTLSLSTQENDNAYVQLEGTPSDSCRLWLWYEHSWPLYISLSFDEYTHYLSITEEPFCVPNKITDNDVPQKTNIFAKEGANLNPGWNQLNVTFDEFHMLE
jgi:hypothetical protein